MSPKKADSDVSAKKRRTGKGAVVTEESDAPDAPVDKDSAPGTAMSSAVVVKREKPDAQEQKQMIARLHYLKKTGKSEALDTYSKLSTNAKRAWSFDVYKQDPSLSKCNTVCQSKSMFRTEESSDAGEWMTLKQIMSFNGYNDEKEDAYESAKTALLAGLEERAHEKPEMAALGIKQYLYTRHKTVKSSGSKKEDSLMECGEVEAKMAQGLSLAFNNMDCGVPQAAPTVQPEPWKKEAMEFERKVAATTARAGKAIQTSQSYHLKLRRIFGQTKCALAGANSDNLLSKQGIIVKAQEDFTVLCASVNSKNEVNAKQMKETLEPAVAVMREHAVHLEKVLNIVKSYLNMSE